MVRDVAADLALVLEAADLGLARPPTVPRNLFLGALPEDDDWTVPDVAVAILSTGGSNAEPYIGSRSVYMRATCQVLVRGPREDHATGQSLAFGVHSALTLPALSPYVFVKVRESAPFRLPTDGSDRPLWSLNVEAQYSSDASTAPPVVGGGIAVGGSAASSAFEAMCLATDVPGALVTVGATDSSGTPVVTTANPSSSAGVPVLGLLVSKPADTVAMVQRSGICNLSSLGLPPLVPGRLVFVGLNGRPTTTAPTAAASPSGVAFVQVVGVALGPALLELTPSPHLVRLG